MVTGIIKFFFRALKFKNLWPALVLFGFSQCDNDAPDPNFDRTVNAQQAPFGTDTVLFKIKNVHYNGILSSSFYYKNGLLDLINQYIEMDSMRIVSTVAPKRMGGKIQSILVRRPEVISVEENYLSSNWIDLQLLDFELPADDSTRVVSLGKNFNNPETKFIYSFNKAGFITKKQCLIPSTPVYNYNEVYFRDHSNNVSVMFFDRSNNIGSDGKTSMTTYEYDDRPNPFFKLGLNSGSIVSINCLSPNNIIKSTYVREDGKILISNYKYEYLSNGYPKAVAVTSTLDGRDLESVERFEYSYYN